jgi:hypothetical protein
MHTQITISVFVDEPSRAAQTLTSPPPPISRNHQIARSRTRTQFAAELANLSGKTLDRRHAAPRSRCARKRVLPKPAPIPKFGLSRDDLKLHFPGSRNDPTILRMPEQLSFNEFLDWGNSQDLVAIVARLPKSPKKNVGAMARRNAND